MGFIDKVKDVIDIGKDIKSGFDDYYAFATGELTKLSIRAYTDISAKKEVQGSPFELMINPSNITRKLTIQKQEQAAIGGKQNCKKYINTSPGTISFDFILDGTGVVNNGLLKEYTKSSVDKQVETFLSIVHLSKGKKQDNGSYPNFLRINYGGFDWPCMLDSLTIDYNLFNAQGKALRAKLTCEFSLYDEKEVDRSTLPKIASGIMDNLKKGGDGKLPIEQKAQDFVTKALSINANSLR